MRKWYSTIDSKTDMEIVFSECSLNEIGYQLECMDINVDKVKYHYDTNDCDIYTDKGHFFYDDERRMLLRDKTLKEGVII
jgi:hypothetical protein